MVTKMIGELFAQLVRKPFTNLFPVKYTPKNVTAVIEKVKKGEIQINPPVPIPEDFRGKLRYDYDKCIGCRMCIRVCPANVFEFRADVKKVRAYLSRCTFCSFCVDVCPTNALWMSEEFLLADTDKYSDNLIEE